MGVRVAVPRRDTFAPAAPSCLSLFLPAMWSFLRALFRNPSAPHTVVVMEEGDVDHSQHVVQPSRLASAWALSLFLSVLLTGAVLALSPVRQLIPGYGTEALQTRARMSYLRVQALQDSLDVQRRYIDRLQQLMTGRVDSTAGQALSSSASAAPTERREDRGAEVPTPRSAETGDWKDHTQPALSVSDFPASETAGSGRGGPRSGRAEAGALPPLPLPAAPPVESGFPTRGFDARTGHYAIDIAVSKGEFVHTVGDGYVVLSDWTQDGGYTIAVQHADGYLSVYKHNQRLLKHVGDRVQARESIAVTGNTGEITTGPHLHFELWRNGLAQDPLPYIAGW